MNISNLLVNIRKASKMKKGIVETNFVVLFNNSQLVNHPDYSEFVSELVSNSTNPENKEILELFANFGASTDLRQHFRYSRFKCMQNQDGRRVQISEFGLTNGKKLEGADWMWCLPASRIFCRKNINIRKDFLILLLKHGLDVCAQSYQGQTILEQFVTHFVESYDSDAKDIAEILVNSGAPVDDYNDMMNIAIICTGNTDLVSFFIQKGADVNKESKIRLFPLYSAVLRYDNVDLVDFLLLSGANLNATNDLGETALHAACFRNHEKTISLLIRKGADISAVNDVGKTPFSSLDPEGENNIQCMRTMIREFAKLSFKNHPLHQIDLNLIQAHPKSREYFESCLLELNLMSRIKFYASYSYFYVLNVSNNNFNKLVSLTKNEEFVASFEKNLVFPLYENDLRRIFEEATQARDRSAAVISRLYLVFYNLFPEIVIRKLEKNLTLEDIPLE